MFASLDRNEVSCPSLVWNLDILGSMLNQLSCRQRQVGRGIGLENAGRRQIRRSKTHILM